MGSTRWGICVTVPQRGSSAVVTELEGGWYARQRAREAEWLTRARESTCAEQSKTWPSSYVPVTLWAANTASRAILSQVLAGLIPWNGRSGFSFIFNLTEFLTPMSHLTEITLQVKLQHDDHTDHDVHDWSRRTWLITHRRALCSTLHRVTLTSRRFYVSYWSHGRWKFMLNGSISWELSSAIRIVVIWEA
jgi:hypothetical protein